MNYLGTSSVNKEREIEGGELRAMDGLGEAVSLSHSWVLWNALMHESI